jgi:hypothetical protein
MICIIVVMVDLLWDIVSKSIKALSKMIGMNYNWELYITNILKKLITFISIKKVISFT